MTIFGANPGYNLHSRLLLTKDLTIVIRLAGIICVRQLSKFNRGNQMTVALRGLTHLAHMLAHWRRRDDCADLSTLFGRSIASLCFYGPWELLDKHILGLFLYHLKTSHKNTYQTWWNHYLVQEILKYFLTTQASHSAFIPFSPFSPFNDQKSNSIDMNHLGSWEVFQNVIHQ